MVDGDSSVKIDGKVEEIGYVINLFLFLILNLSLDGNYIKVF